MKSSYTNEPSFDQSDRELIFLAGDGSLILGETEPGRLDLGELGTAESVGDIWRKGGYVEVDGVSEQQQGPLGAAAWILPVRLTCPQQQMGRSISGKVCPTAGKSWAKSLKHTTKTAIMFGE